MGILTGDRREDAARQYLLNRIVLGALRRERAAGLCLLGIVDRKQLGSTFPERLGHSSYCLERWTAAALDDLTNAFGAGTGPFSEFSEPVGVVFRCRKGGARQSIDVGREYLVGRVHRLRMLRGPAWHDP